MNEEQEIIYNEEMERIDKDFQNQLKSINIMGQSIKNANSQNV
jgi:hypothetical protein